MVSVFRDVGGLCADTQQTWESLGKAYDVGTQPHP
eukprot:COSAG02_NODE_686_length_18484_cov_29.523851_15_plen_35_part_00